MLPSLPLLEKISQEIKNIPNRRKESKRVIHHGLFLLGYKSGLRISEAVNFDLSAKNKQGLYRIERPKGKKERFVYIPKKVISELKKNNWQPNQTNRYNFYHFLKKIKRELNINRGIELTPHTLRRAFATYQAESGIPLPLLQKLLGHSSIRTTALYWQNIHGDNDTEDILAGKRWLENKEKEPPQLPSKNFPERPSLNLEPTIRNKPAIPTKKPIQHNNPLLLTEISEKPTIINYQPKSVISQVSSQTPRIIKSKKEQENQKENILLAKIRNLEEQLKQIQTENSNLKVAVQSVKQNNQLSKQTITNLTHKIQAGNQNHTNLINAYQKAFNDKARVELFAEKEKQQVDNYQQQLKVIAKSLYQWQKIKHYQQLEQEQTKLEAKVEQPPPLKDNK